jgi:multiple antibiotic resistance protein
MQAFWLCFVPLFVAVDAFGILPLFLGLTEGSEPLLRRRIILQSVLTATLVTLAFVFAGTAFLRLLGISVADFMVAGGALLFALSLSELIAPHRATEVRSDVLGAVPLGVPLLAGPAVLTTSMLLVEQHGRLITIVAVIGNMLLAGAILWFSGAIYRVLGTTGTRVLQRVTLLLLAAIAVMTVRKGLAWIIHEDAPCFEDLSHALSIAGSGLLQ